MIKLLLFDIGGVLIDYRNDWYYDYLAKVSSKERQLVERLVGPQEDLLTIGMLPIRDFNRRIARLLGIMQDKVCFADFFSRRSKVNRDVIKMLRALHNRYKTAILSNTEFPRQARIRRMIDYKLFDYLFASCSMGLMKPDPRIYRQVLKRTGLKADQILFMDDKKRNTDAARKIGMRVFVVRNSRSLVKMLKRL